MNFNSSRQNSNTGFISLLVIILVLLFLLTAGIGFYVWKNNHNMSVDEGNSVPGADLYNTISTPQGVFPDLPADYVLIDRHGSVLALGESEYVTTKSAEEVKSDMTDICVRYKFKIRPNDGNSDLHCTDANNSWAFRISSSSEITQQTWYKESSQQNTNPTGSTWLEVESQGTIVPD